MYPPPAGKDLTPEHARELDDTFLSSDPFEYFRSRIASLLAWCDTSLRGGPSPPDGARSTVRTEFNRYLQRAAADGPFSDIAVHAQVAADALAVRHHAAEALLRLACVRLTPDVVSGVRCLWAEIASGPPQIADVIARLAQGAQSAHSGERFLRSLVPSHSIAAARADAEVIDAVNVFGEWLGYAAELLSPAEINIQAAHNKVKHGLAGRARADMRVVFSTARPNEDGTVPLSALTGERSLDVFDQPVLELLARGPKVCGHQQGLEVTQLRLKPAALLADAYMLAMTHGAMFHVAAVEHFAGRGDLRDGLGPPDSPGSPVGGPRPTNIDAASPLGMRFPLTTPPGGGRLAREAGIGFRTRFQTLRIDYHNRTRGCVVDD